jgi:hypothetical protein
MLKIVNLMVYTREARQVRGHNECLTMVQIPDCFL